MWSSSRNDHLKKGFVLPLTLILLTFGSIMVFVAGLHVSRTTDKIQSYNIIANQQNIASNVVEAASYEFFEKSSPSFNATWSGIDDFKDYVTNRGGIKGSYWGMFLGDLDEFSSCLDLSTDIQGYKSSPGFGDGRYDIRSYVYPVGNKRIVIGIAERDERKRYSVGLLSYLANPSLPAVRLGELSRDLAKMHSLNGNKVEGDLVFGRATILSDVLIRLTDSSTPAEIIYPSFEASSLTIIGDYSGDLDNWFTATSTENASEIIEGWKEEHLSSLPPDASTTAYINNKNTWPESFNTDTLYIIDATNTTDQNFYVDFDADGMHIRQLDTIGEGESFVGNNILTIPATVANSSKIHLQINGNIAIGDDPHKITRVDGKYSLTVCGDIHIRTNLVYDEIYEFVNNGNGESKVSNHPLDITKDVITEMIESNENDELDLVSIGGDAIMEYEHGTHGVKFLSGDIMAFEDGGTGGDISFPDLTDVITGGVTSQFFTFGSLTANTFDADGNLIYYDNTGNDKGWKNALESLILVANNLVDDSSATTSSELQLIGMRTW
ncbi:MAG: hypothetical protein U9O65_03575 [Thermotogota bacterium]|nr:hypothetical protein [Thermotogota bacterium]